MHSFKGQYEHSIDEKGRVAFPAKLRKLLSGAAQDRFVIVRGRETCLYLYTEEEWGKVEEAFSKANSFSRNARIVKRTFLRFAEDALLDKQNRIAIPADHMSYAQLNTRAVFVGVGNYIEIWSPEELEAMDADMDDEALDDIFESVLGGNLENHGA
ncbi:MAG: division/cell wall cluster transcriptional repressor MraZ [Bacteroidota bacterium]